MWEVTKNPPLNSYFIALTAHFVGWGERVLHLIFFIPAIAVIIGTYFLARKFTREPLVASFSVLFTPVFFISSNTMMCDITMTAIWIWAIILWVRGTEKNNHIALIASSILVAIASLTKYYGAALIPLLLTYSIIKKRNLKLWFIYLLFPVVILGFYEWLTHLIYGVGLFSGAANYAKAWVSGRGESFVNKTLLGLVFTGGCLTAVFFYISLLWPKRYFIYALIIGLAIVFFVVTRGGR